MRSVSSWGRLFHFSHETIAPAFLPEDAALFRTHSSVLAHGLGRSYGDSCLNADGALIMTSGLDRLRAFDPEAGTVICEAGMSFDALLRFLVPRGFFVPVTPGTRFVTVGGAVANDVHGKNHHGAGTFGCHVRRLGLLRSDGKVRTCSPEENQELFQATIGGLGLTGLILWVEFALLKIPGPYVALTTTRFRGLDAFLKLSEEAHEPYSVAWLDTTDHAMRGLFFTGHHAERPGTQTFKQPLPVPFTAPNGLLNRATIRAFNKSVYAASFLKGRHRLQDLVAFFHPLDGLGAWNRLYGSRGFYQYQFVVPFAAADTLPRVMELMRAARQASFLTVLKTFGARRSPGLLSFPMPGITLNLDLPNRGEATLSLLRELEALVGTAGGRVYPAKDAMMSAAAFQAFFPQWRTFAAQVDPAFSSSFWRRVSHA